MGQGFDRAGNGHPAAAKLIEDLLEQLLIVLIKREPGMTLKIPATEVDKTGGFRLNIEVDDFNKEFRFAVVPTDEVLKYEARPEPVVDPEGYTPKTGAAGGSPLDPDYLTVNEKNGMQKQYVVLTPEERAKGFTRPLRFEMTHTACGRSTRLHIDIAETYARKADFYDGTYCYYCMGHYPLKQFKWTDTDITVGD